jgi:spore coat polysaccharide biosynthesis protein SpsF (cytidylyltransferase family)
MAIEVLAIIQARMGSTRLPGKTLARIEGKPLLEHVINRVRFCESIDKIIVATTMNPEDKEIISVTERMGVETYAGSPEDVLDRFYKAAVLCDGKTIVRITADDPFKDPRIIDEIVEFYLAHQEYDYVSNTVKPTFPIGIDVEVFSFEALERAWQETESVTEREHVTPYIWRNPELFKTRNIENDTQLSHLRWTIDTEEDLVMAREVYRHLYVDGHIFYMQDILELLVGNKGIIEINSGVKQAQMSETKEGV